jgi:polysaccharide export outer membrane protein
MNMIRTAICSAILAAIPALCGGMTTLQQANEPAPQTKEQQAPAADRTAKAAPAAADAEPGKGVPASNPPAVLANDNKYVIGAEDQLMINVWGDARLSGPVMVRPDGRISINLIGEMMASNKTPEMLGRDIEETLRQKEILRRPQVNVTVTAVLSKKYMINGEVLKPGPNPLLVPSTVLEALVNAGGFKDFANKKKIEVIRGAQRFKFNWSEVIKGKNLQQNILLEPGDLIIVP